MLGIDEVGRGALAGPLVVAGCFCDSIPDFYEALNDSKLLSRKKREQLAEQILLEWQTFTVEISPTDLDEFGLTESLRKAVLLIANNLPTRKGIILDGSYNFLQDTQYSNITNCVPKADRKFKPVMAASIIAKVHRDNLMRKHAHRHSQYGFENNVGYGTGHHLQALKRFGPCELHRKSFAPVKLVSRSRTPS
jgi:ribonuclease HII